MGDTLAELMRGKPLKVLELGPFKIREAESHEELEEAFRLRFRVFSEAGFIEAADFPDGSFRDDFDPCSVHFLVFGPGDQLVATTRFVLPSDTGYATEHLFCVEPPDIDRSRLGEFGRSIWRS